MLVTENVCCLIGIISKTYCVILLQFQLKQVQLTSPGSNIVSHCLVPSVISAIELVTYKFAWLIALTSDNLALSFCVDK